MSQELAQNEGRPGASRSDRRRSQRVLIRVTVTLHLEAPEKRSVKAHTSNVSAHGALLICPENLPLGTRFVLEHNGSRERQACHIARHAKHTQGGFEVGVEFENPAPGFWHIVFPAVDWKSPGD